MINGKRVLQSESKHISFLRSTRPLQKNGSFRKTFRNEPYSQMAGDTTVQLSTVEPADD